MQLFSIDKNQLSGNRIIITGAELHHLKNVLRKGKNEEVIFHDQSWLYKTRIISIDSDQCLCEIISRTAVQKRTPCTVNLYPSLIQYSKFEVILDHCTQMGINSITPMHTQFTQKYELSANRLNRWQKIIQEAGKQSSNPVPPLLHPLIPFSEAVRQKGNNCLLHPDSGSDFKKTLSGFSPPVIINLFIGPEGGFSGDEIKLAIQNKFYIVTMPFNILRAETAVLAAVSSIFFYFQ